MSNNAELLDWYFAFLRKDAHIQSATPSSIFTPMALVKADQELIEKAIEQDLKAMAAAEAAAKARILDDTPTSSLNEKLWLSICIGVCLATGAAIVLGVAAKELAVLALIACACICLFVIRKKSQEEIKFRQLLKARLAQCSNSAELISVDETKSSSDYAIHLVSELAKQLELMQQKEILLFDYCPHLLCTLNADRKILALNKNAGKVLGYEPVELIGKKFEDLIMMAREKFEASLERCKRLGKPESITICTRNKQGNAVHLLWRNEWSASTQVYFCFAQDISIQVELEQLKAEMSTMITHDLRAPISGLVFWTDNMLSGCYGELNEDSVISLNQGKINLQGVLRLLDNLLAVDKVDSGALKPSKGRVRVYDCFKQVVNQLGEWAKDSEVKFEAESSETLVNGDYDQIIRILTNFCSNALKWSPAKSTVRLRTRVEGSFALIEVEDEGPGIPPELKETLFQRWVMFGSRTAQGPGSSGIGLYIAKRFAELHGGTVGARDGEKTGSVFWFTIPLWE